MMVRVTILWFITMMATVSRHQLWLAHTTIAMATSAHATIAAASCRSEMKTVYTSSSLAYKSLKDGRLPYG